jgi:hypothetical protein
MIFKKILSGTDLIFDISLDDDDNNNNNKKKEYTPGETVKGILSIVIKKASKIRAFRLSAQGDESTIITVSESTNSSGGSSTNNSGTKKTYAEHNIFFSKDLSHLIKSINTHILPDGTLEILPQHKQIPFDFIVSNNNNEAGTNILFSSYKGKNANITYSVKATADIENRLDINKEVSFSVINPNKKKIVYPTDTLSSLSSVDTDVNTTTTIEDNMQSSSSSFSSTEKIVEGGEVVDTNNKKFSASERFEQLFGRRAAHRHSYFTPTGTGVNIDLIALFSKGRDHFTKENSEAKLEIIDGTATYYPGQLINGKVIILKNLEDQKKKNIREMKIALNGIEQAFAQGHERITTVEKYEEKIKLNGFDNNNNDNNNNHDDKDSNISILPFKIRIPHGVNRSYIGKYSEYFWGLQAKINMAWSSDIEARTIVDIV